MRMRDHDSEREYESEREQGSKRASHSDRSSLLSESTCSCMFESEKEGKQER